MMSMTIKSLNLNRYLNEREVVSIVGTYRTCALYFFANDTLHCLSISGSEIKDNNAFLIVITWPETW